MKLVIAPCSALGKFDKFVVNIYEGKERITRAGNIICQNLIVMQPCCLHSVSCIIVQDRVQVDMCLWRASVNTVHNALDVTEYLLRSKIQTSAGSNVVCANHHKYLGRTVGNVAFDIFALFGRVGTRVAATAYRQIVAICITEYFLPDMHVGNTVTNHYNAAGLRGQNLESVITCHAERTVCP